MLVSTLISNGERTPLFTDNREYASVYADYGRTTGKLTQLGEQHLYKLGEEARRKYVFSNFMPIEYDATTVFVRTPNDHPSVMSAYAYIMGMYPNSIEGVDLMSGLGELSSIPITEDEVNAVRFDVRSPTPD